MPIFRAGKDASGKKERSERIEKAPEDKKTIKKKKDDKKGEVLEAKQSPDKDSSVKLNRIRERIKLKLKREKRRNVEEKKTFSQKGFFAPAGNIKIDIEDTFLKNAFLRIILSLSMALLGSLLLTISFEPYGFWPLIFVAFVPIITAVHRIAPRRLAGLVMAFGVAGFFWGFFKDIYGAADFFLLNYIYIIAAIIFFFIGSLQRAFHGRTHYRWFIIEGAIIWTGFEMIRGLIPSLGTNGFLATALYKSFWFLQPVSMLSIYGLTLLIIFINYVLSFKVIAYLDSRIVLTGEIAPLKNSAAKRWLFMGAAIFLAWFAFSLSLLQNPLPAVRVAAIQPGHYVHETVFGGELRKVFRKSVEFQEDFDELLDISRRAARDNARFLVWNEGALPFNPHFRGTDELQDFVKETGVYLALGYRVLEDKTEGITILSPDGVFLGSSYQTLIGSIGTATSKDLNNTRGFRKIVGEGTRIVALSTFHSNKQGPRLMPNAVFRAIENHLSIVNADGHYASAIIDPYGRLIQYTSSEFSARRILIADIPAGSGNTLVVLWGDWLGWLSLAGTVFFLIVMTMSNLRSKETKSLVS